MRQYEILCIHGRRQLATQHSWRIHLAGSSPHPHLMIVKSPLLMTRTVIVDIYHGDASCRGQFNR